MKNILIVGAIAIMFLGGYLFQINKEQETLKGYGNYYLEQTLLTATTTNATSTDNGSSVSIEGAKRAVFTFSRGDSTGTGNSGASVFSVEVSSVASGATSSPWVDFNMLIDNVTNSNSQQITRVSEVSLSGTSTKKYPMDLTSGNYQFVRCIVEETTDGNHTCAINLEY